MDSLSAVDVIFPKFAWRTPEQLDKEDIFVDERVFWRMANHGYNQAPIYDFGRIIGIHPIKKNLFNMNLWCLKTEGGDHDRQRKVIFINFLNQLKVFKKKDIVYLCDKVEGAKEKIGMIISGPHQSASGLLYYEVLCGNQKQHVSPSMLFGENKL